MKAEGAVDERERRVLARALRELGFDPSQFAIEVVELPPNQKSRSLPGGVLPRRKAVIATFHPTGDTFRHETYADNPWAGEVIQEVAMGRLGAKPA